MASQHTLALGGFHCTTVSQSLWLLCYLLYNPANRVIYLAFNAALTIIAIMVTQYDHTLRGVLQADAESNERLDLDLEEAISAMTRIDAQNEMLEKCVKLTASLRALLKSLRPNKSEYAGSHSATQPPTQTSMFGSDEVVQSEAKGAYDGLFPSTTEFLAPDFQSCDMDPSFGDIFMSSSFMENYAKENLFC